MERKTAISLMKRALRVLEEQRPEMAERYMEVPLGYYDDPDFAARERELFERQPLALIAANEIAERFDFLVRSVLGRSILLTRDGDGRARAFLNYCRHRGAEVASGCGNRRAFSCPYHGWTYGPTGELVGLPLRDRHSELDFARLGLVELPSEERHGFVWVVLDPDVAIDVAAHLGALDADLAGLGVAEMTYTNSLPEEPLAANWKSVAEGLLEGLHVPFVHKGTFDQNPQAAGVDLAFYDSVGPHVRYGMPLFGADDVARIRATAEEEWEPERSIGCIWFIAPGLLLANELYGLIYADLSPGASPDRANFRYGWLSPTRSAPNGLPSPEEMAARAATAVGQDKPVWEGCGRGLTHGAHEYALIGRNEKGVQLFHENLARQTGFGGLRYA